MNNRKFIKNPLTIIGIFSGIAEVSIVVAIKLVNPELQYIFMWFVIGFPLMIVTLFFLTLIYRPEVLYAPSDFRNEENFLISMKYKKQRRQKK